MVDAAVGIAAELAQQLRRIALVPVRWAAHRRSAAGSLRGSALQLRSGNGFDHADSGISGRAQISRHFPGSDRFRREREGGRADLSRYSGRGASLQHRLHGISYADEISKEERYRVTNLAEFLRC